MTDSTLRTTEHTSEELKYAQLALMQALVFRVKEKVIMALAGTLGLWLLFYPFLSDKRAVWPGTIGIWIWFAIRITIEMYLALYSWRQLNEEIKQAKAYENSNNRS